MRQLETTRLLLRPFHPNDASDLFEYAKLPTVGPNAGWAPHESIEESKKIIAHFIEKDDVWAVVLKEQKKVIGSIGLHERISISGELVREIGYVLSTPYEGHGYMTEACKRVMEYAFMEMNYPRIKVAHFIGNLKSQRVIEKCGFTYEGEGTHQSVSFGPKLSKIYYMTKKQYLELGGRIMYTWDLSKLYFSFEDEAYKNDLQRFNWFVDELAKSGDVFASTQNAASKLVHHLEQLIDFNILADRLFQFASLQQSTDSTSSAAIKALNQLQTKVSQLSSIDTTFRKWLLKIDDLDDLISSDSFLKEHEFYLHEQHTIASHLLDESTESLISQLKQTGSLSWGRLQSLLTSTLAVSYQGKDITLSEVRNLAYEADASIRKNAYFAELESYRLIEKSIAFSINAIKGEVNTISAKRGFASPLDQTLEQSRMTRKTLDAMISAMEEKLPKFRDYLKRKAQLLGHQGALPFYDLFAPIGSVSQTFSVEEARDYILKNFGTFSPRLHDMAKKAFDDHWIDFFPKKGKVGGAFCSNATSIKESRVLTNFTGSFSDVITLAHELGHAYHGENIFNQSPLNSDYTMPVAETASTFCETIVNKAAFKDAKSKQERIYLLESSIQDATQVIVDIMSRFLFERSVFEGRKETIFDESELKALMIDAQKKTYGDGLDENFLHPYMWLCKSHYYSGNLSYYNFPYAFGLLFAKGLYAKYLEQKDSFVMLYDRLLSATGKSSVEDAAKIAGIDVTDKAFWQASLKMIEEDIDLFLELTK